MLNDHLCEKKRVKNNKFLVYSLISFIVVVLSNTSHSRFRPKIKFVESNHALNSFQVLILLQLFTMQFVSQFNKSMSKLFRQLLYNSKFFFSFERNKFFCLFLNRIFIN